MGEVDRRKEGSSNTKIISIVYILASHIIASLAIAMPLIGLIALS